jgi:heme-degrading monooxygenase HmoA
LIDAFSVPADSKAAFLDLAHQAQRFAKTLPGFVEGYIYEQQSGTSRYNFLTTAVWENEAAFENAKQAVAREYQRRSFNPQETLNALGIELVRSTYERSPY